MWIALVTRYTPWVCIHEQCVYMYYVMYRIAHTMCMARGRELTHSICAPQYCNACAREEQKRRARRKENSLSCERERANSNRRHKSGGAERPEKGQDWKCAKKDDGMRSWRFLLGRARADTFFLSLNAGGINTRVESEQERRQFKKCTRGWNQCPTNRLHKSCERGRQLNRIFIHTEPLLRLAVVFCATARGMNAANPFTITELFMTAARANEMQSSQNVGCGLLYWAYQTHSMPHIFTLFTPDILLVCSEYL